ncbi:MAG: hypothetical protein E6R04_03185 [Spirochaetes bacterium]|nr:MAG: hypothetical protein E6R04_03185 [Spirochaetota bacterium]
MTVAADVHVAHDLSIIEYLVMGTLHRDHRKWLELVKSHAAEGFSVPASKAPHMCPSQKYIPCMFCTAHSGEINAVSAAIMLSVSEERMRDDMWNAHVQRRPDHIVTAVKAAMPSVTQMEDMLGSNWVMVLALAYRVELADAVELARLLRAAVTLPAGATPSALVGARDWSHAARWLLSAALSGNRHPTHTSARLRTRETTGRLAPLAHAMSSAGTLDFTGETVQEWANALSIKDSSQAGSPGLRVVR